jgi:prevent-host-death family protein
MVMKHNFMTMSSTHWSIAAAKAKLSRLVQEARDAPQVIENRGRPVAVVVSAEQYERMTMAHQASRKWRSVLELSAEIREEGGVTLKLPRRERRRSPF